MVALVTASVERAELRPCGFEAVSGEAHARRIRSGTAVGTVLL
jgi:hypothetical protein